MNEPKAKSQLQEQMALFRKAVLKDPMPYWLGGILLGFLNVALFIFFKSPWGVTTPFANWGAWIWQKLGGVPETWPFWSSGTVLQDGFLKDGMSLQNVGIIAGAFLAVLLASQFRIKKIKSWKQLVAGAAGGLLMGYGARIAFGCNIGAFFSGTASMSLHGWIYVVFIFVGAYIGSKILVKWLL